MFPLFQPCIEWQSVKIVAEPEKLSKQEYYESDSWIGSVGEMKRTG